MIHKEVIESQLELAEILEGHGLGIDDLAPINYPLSIQELFQSLNQLSQDNPLRERISSVLEIVVHNSNLYSENKGGMYSIKSWPHGNERQLSNELFLSESMALIDKKTPIVSMGSCFAVEIARWLQVNNYNYLVTESNVIASGVHASSCRWGTIFNTPGFYQTISRAFNNDMPSILHKTGGKYRDIFREDVVYNEDELNDFDKDYEQHVLSSRKALLECKVLILTVGLNEVFQHLPTQRYLHRNPWNLNPFLWREKVLTVEENVEFLRKGIDLLREENKDVVILISVSPVPLIRSFRGGHVAVNTFHSKAVLRCAVEEVCSVLDNVHYMPSFETVMYHGSINPWQEDERHVNDGIVSKIMNLFEFQFCKNLEVEIKKAKYLESKAISEFFYNLPTELKTNAEIKIRFDTHINSLLTFHEKYNDDQAREAAYLIMRKHYALFGDVIDRIVSAQISKNFPRSDLKLESFQSVFQYNESDIVTAAKNLSEEGYHICPFKLNKQDIKKITRCFDDNIGEHKESGRLMVAQDQLIKNVFILNLLLDKFFIEIASRYLDTLPVLDFIAGMDTRAGYLSEEKLNADAMMFHFDKDRISWLKVFIYLDDVSADNGPHCYVSGSHKNRSGGLLHDGKFTDEEVEQYYGKDSIKTITGEAGSIFLGDTHCLHKGTVVNTGRRRVLQLEYCNSLFGARVEPLLLDESQLIKLTPLIADHPRMFMNFRVHPEDSVVDAEIR